MSDIVRDEPQNGICECQYLSEAHRSNVYPSIGSVDCIWPFFSLYGDRSTHITQKVNTATLVLSEDLFHARKLPQHKDQVSAFG
jgi:hypothetical protein